MNDTPAVGPNPLRPSSSARASRVLLDLGTLATRADYSMAFAIRVAASIGLADHLVDGPKHVSSLSAAVACDAHGLLRLLRALATQRVFRESAPETFELTALSELLRSDHLAQMKQYLTSGRGAEGYAKLPAALRQGHDATPAAFQMPGLRAPPLLGPEMAAIFRSYQWAAASSVVLYGPDVEALRSELRSRYPAIEARTISGAANWRSFGQEPGEGERSSVAIATGATKQSAAPLTLHCLVNGTLLLDDASTLETLHRIKSAMAARERLLLIEHLAGGDDLLARELDLLALAGGGCALRTESELLAIVSRAQLQLQQVTRTKFLSIIEVENPDATISAP